jgi:hypothetical protein
MATNREKFYKEHNISEDSSLSLEEISKLSKIPEAALQEVYNRGTGAWKTSLGSVRLKDGSKNYNTGKYPRSARMTKEQWSFGRVYAFVMKTTKVYYGADDDIREKYNLK